MSNVFNPSAFRSLQALALLQGLAKKQLWLYNSLTHVKFNETIITTTAHARSAVEINCEKWSNVTYQSMHVILHLQFGLKLS